MIVSMPLCDPMLRFVAVEAPAGCGKTFKGADYAREIAIAGGPNRLLILTIHMRPAQCSRIAPKASAPASKSALSTVLLRTSRVPTTPVSDFRPTSPRGFVNAARKDMRELALSVAALLNRYR